MARKKLKRRTIKIITTKNHKMKKLNLRKYVWVLLIALISVSCERATTFESPDELVNQALQNIDLITAEQLKEKMDNGDMILLVDVRDKNEHSFGYIPGSVNISRGTIEFKIGNQEFWDNEFLFPPEKTDEIIVYCKKGKRGALAAHTLQQLGYTNVKNLEGGWKQWEHTYPLLYEKNLEDVGHGAVEEEGGC
jgi:rhodanese-related sulfurtransferase